MYNLDKSNYVSIERIAFTCRSVFNLKYANSDFRRWQLDPVDNLEVPDASDYGYNDVYVIEKGNTVIRPNARNDKFYLVTAIYQNPSDFNRSFVEIQELDKEGNVVGSVNQIPLVQAKSMEFSSLDEYRMILQEEREKEEVTRKRREEQEKRFKKSPGKSKKPYIKVY